MTAGRKRYRLLKLHFNPRSDVHGWASPWGKLPGVAGVMRDPAREKRSRSLKLRFNTVGEGLGPPAFVIVTPDDTSAVILSRKAKDLIPNIIHSVNLTRRNTDCRVAHESALLAMTAVVASLERLK